MNNVTVGLSDLTQYIADKMDVVFNDLIEQWNHPDGTSTKYFIVDDLLPKEVALNIFDAFPQDEKIWEQRCSFREKKKTFARLNEISPLIADITDAFHHKKIVSLVSKITKYQDLEPDSNLYAGGISMMGPGDFLNPHIDNSHDANRSRYRRLNLLYYISPDWSLDNGGNFELWDEHVINPKVILSKFNRLVVMETNKKSWHSVNEVVVNKNRCCISNYYFSQSSPEEKDYYHVTSFLGRPKEKWKRAYGKIDNFFRNFVASKFKISRGKNLVRNK